MFENVVFTRIFAFKREEWTGGRRKFLNEHDHNLYSLLFLGCTNQQVRDGLDV